MTAENDLEPLDPETAKEMSHREREGEVTERTLQAHQGGMEYETDSGRQFTGGELARMAMHGDIVTRDGELYVSGERITPVDPEDES